jgi:hypothetical protein
MAITVNFNCDGGLLRVCASGEDENLEQVKEYGMSIIKAALEFNCTRILCDETELTYNLSQIDTFDSARFISENAPKVGKTAIVCKPNQAKDALFWETVSVNRGITVKVFTSLLEAEEWIFARKAENA